MIGRGNLNVTVGSIIRTPNFIQNGMSVKMLGSYVDFGEAILIEDKDSYFIFQRHLYHRAPLQASVYI